MSAALRIVIIIIFINSLSLFFATAIRGIYDTAHVADRARSCCVYVGGSLRTYVHALLVSFCFCGLGRFVLLSQFSYSCFVSTQPFSFWVVHFFSSLFWSSILFGFVVFLLVVCLTFSCLFLLFCDWYCWDLCFLLCSYVLLNCFCLFGVLCSFLLALLFPRFVLVFFFSFFSLFLTHVFFFLSLYLFLYLSIYFSLSLSLFLSLSGLSCLSVEATFRWETIRIRKAHGICRRLCVLAALDCPHN